MKNFCIFVYLSRILQLAMECVKKKYNKHRFLPLILNFKTK